MSGKNGRKEIAWKGVEDLQSQDRIKIYIKDTRR
jgi:hypothetical protein